MIRVSHSSLILAVWTLCTLSAFGAPPSPIQSRSIYHSKTVWESQEGTKTPLSKLRGTPVIATLVYTGCLASCPLVMADLKALEKGLPNDMRGKVRIAVFSMDSEADSPKKLKEFSKKHGVDLDRWIFFHGSSASVRELAALLGVRFKLLDNGVIDHANVITLLDSEGVIAHQQVGLRQNPDESLKVLQKLAQ